MHALIVFAHPEPASFNGTLKDAAAARLEALGHTVEVSDLYGEAFDPVEGAAHYADRQDPDHFAALAEQRHAGQRGTLPADVRREIARIERADLVIFQFPLWWHAQPAILKGWFDRVFVNGLLYSGSKRYDRGFFAAGAPCFPSPPVRPRHLSRRVDAAAISSCFCGRSTTRSTIWASPSCRLFSPSVWQAMATGMTTIRRRRSGSMPVAPPGSPA